MATRGGQHKRDDRPAYLTCAVCVQQMIGGPRCYQHNPTPEMRAANPSKYQKITGILDQVIEPEESITCNVCGWTGVVREAKLEWRDHSQGSHLRANCARCNQYIKFVARS